MDVTIAFNEVTTLLRCILTLEACTNLECIRVLHRHFKQALQCLPCPPSTLHGWKGLVMARELYTLLTKTPFRCPTNPGANTVYVRSIDPNNPGVVPDPAVPLTKTEQATINTTFARCKYYYQSLINIKQACFTMKEYARAEGVSNMPKRREYRPEIWSRFGVGVRSFS
jgi:hypothetical protein